VRVASNLRKALGTNKGHVLLLTSGGNLPFDAIDQPLLNPSLRFEAPIPIDLRGGCNGFRFASSRATRQTGRSVACDFEWILAHSQLLDKCRVIRHGLRTCRETILAG
jgi:hypothetical protein